MCEPAKLTGWCVNFCFRHLSGDVPVIVRGSRPATKLSNYFQDREKFLRNKMSTEEFEGKWSGVQIAGREVFADADQVLRMANADIFQIEHLYASVESAE